MNRPQETQSWPDSFGRGDAKVGELHIKELEQEAPTLCPSARAADQTETARHEQVLIGVIPNMEIVVGME